MDLTREMAFVGVAILPACSDGRLTDNYHPPVCEEGMEICTADPQAIVS